MTDHRQSPIEMLEVSKFTTELFKTLNLVTIGDLCELNERRVLNMARALKARTPKSRARAPRRSLNEVKQILADMDLSLKP
ncbi:MAG: DNA-directed RNA polymerase alpha subunit [Myxococcota bacterium]|jgi:DNA-directed RNA polymerase alpha subunit